MISDTRNDDLRGSASRCKQLGNTDNKVIPAQMGTMLKLAKYVLKVNDFLSQAVSCLSRASQFIQCGQYSLDIVGYVNQTPEVGYFIFENTTTKWKHAARRADQIYEGIYPRFPNDHEQRYHSNCQYRQLEEPGKQRAGAFQKFIPNIEMRLKAFNQEIAEEWERMIQFHLFVVEREYEENGGRKF